MKKKLEIQTTGFPTHGNKLVNQDFFTYAEICSGKRISVKKTGPLEGAILTAYAAKIPYVLYV